MTVSETLERAIERLTSELDSASRALSDVTIRRDNVKAEIDALDADIESHYALIGRIYCRNIDRDDTTLLTARAA
jgi:chromosome segregation ATPase